jgi:hypothetical protein
LKCSKSPTKQPSAKILFNRRSEFCSLEMPQGLDFQYQANDWGYEKGKRQQAGL